METPLLLLNRQPDARDTLKVSESRPQEVGTSQRKDPSPIRRGGRRRHRGTKRKRIVRRDKATALTEPETINAPTAPIADVDTVGPLGGGGNEDAKPTNLLHPEHLLKGEAMRLYDVRQRLQVRREVLETSKKAGEQPSTLQPLLGLTVKQRRLSLSDPKDKKGNLENDRYSKAQALPVKRDAKEVIFERSPAAKGEHVTWRGEVASKSKFRRTKAESRLIELEQGAREGHATILSPANPSAQQSSQLATGLPHTDRNKSKARFAPSASRIHKSEHRLQTDRDRSKNMSNPRGVPHSGRGRNTGRLSRIQLNPDDVESSFRVSPNTSSGGARRPRGFQPTEVNLKKTSAAEQSKDLTKALTPRQASADNLELQRRSDVAARREIPRLGEYTSSLTQPINPVETRELEPYCWTKVASHPEGPVQEWDSGEQDLNQPSWKLRDAIAATHDKAAKNANMENLPPYKFPRRRGQHKAAESSSRHPAGVEKATVQHLPENSRSPNVGTISAPKHSSHNEPTESTKTNSINVVSHSTKDASTGLPGKGMGTTVPPHMRSASRYSESKDLTAKPPTAAVQQLQHQLTDAAGSEKIKNKPGISIYEDTEGTATIAAMLKYEVPPQFQGPRLHSAYKIEKTKATTLFSDDRQHNSTLSKPDTDEEVATGLNAIDHDKELASALQAESFGKKKSTRQKEHDDFQVSNHQAHALQTKKSFGAKDTNQTQNTTLEATNKQENQVITPKSTAQALGETANVRGGPVNAQQPVPKPSTLAVTGSDGLRIITNDESMEQAQTKDVGASATTPKSAVKAGKQVTKDVAKQNQTEPVRAKNIGAFANTSISAVRAGKQPARNEYPLHNHSGSATWDGNLGPPLLGEDWADREQFNDGGPDRKAMIEAWREDNAIDPEVGGGVRLDTKSIVFQNGKVMIGGNADIFSFIDDAAHVAIPNDDEFTQIHRGRSSATAIEEFKAMSASKGKSTRSGESNRARRPERRGHKREIRIPDADFLDLPSKGIEPEANMYLRPAEAGDMRQCTQIYNQWAVDTSFTVAKESVNTAFWTENYHGSQAEKLPFIVAVHMGDKPCRSLKDVKREKGETIVGFSVAIQYGSDISVYRYSAELELYVHREHLRQGIGRTMLDRMLATLCHGYYLIELAPFLLSKEHRRVDWAAGGMTNIYTVTINLLHSAEEDKETIEWKKKWLLGGRNMFEYAGTIPKIGYKFCKPVDNCLMVRETGCIHDPC